MRHRVKTWLTHRWDQQTWCQESAGGAAGHAGRDSCRKFSTCCPLLIGLALNSYLMPDAGQFSTVHLAELCLQQVLTAMTGSLQALSSSSVSSRLRSKTAAQAGQLLPDAVPHERNRLQGARSVSALLNGFWHSLRSRRQQEDQSCSHGQKAKTSKGTAICSHLCEVVCAQSASFAVDVGKGWQCCAIRDQDTGPEEAAAAPVHIQVRLLVLQVGLFRLQCPFECIKSARPHSAACCQRGTEQSGHTRSWLK